MNCQDEKYLMRLFYCFITFGVCITSFMYYLYMKIIFISIDGLNFELSVMVFAICTCCLGIIRMVTHRKRDYGILEADSRAYAEEAVAAYYREIDRLLEE